jgi:TRAP-type transport system periplasmic protein
MKKSSIILSLILGLATIPATAAPVKLKFASPSPPKAHLNVQIFGPWVEKVTADSNGSLDVELVAGRVLASHQNLYDRVKTNVAQIGWSLQGFVPGKFKKSNVVGLPLLFEASAVGSMAMWRLFERGLISDEYQDVKLLGAFTFPPNALHTNSPVKNLEDLKGMKIGSTGPMRLATVGALGATPISMITPKIYQNVSRGLVKGTFIAWTAFQPYRLYEVTKFHTDVALGGGAGMIIMNKQVYDGLQTDARKAIDMNAYAGLVRKYAEFWDRIQNGSKKKFGSMAGHTLIKISDKEKNRWAEKTKAVHTKWANATPNGVNILNAFKEEIAKIKAGK